MNPINGQDEQGRPPCQANRDALLDSTAASLGRIRRSYRFRSRCWVIFGLGLICASACQFESEPPASVAEKSLLRVSPRRKPISDDHPNDLASDSTPRPTPDDRVAELQESARETETRLVSRNSPTDATAANALVVVDPSTVSGPEVVLSSAHLATCRLRQGDPLPDFAVVDRRGKPLDVRQWFDTSKRPMLLVFWSQEQSMSRALVTRLQAEVGDLYPTLQLVAVHVGPFDDWSSLELGAEDQASIHWCVDPQKNAFNKFAADLLPRTYLVNSDGRISWFDIDYSRTSRRLRRQAIEDVLAISSQPR